MSQQKSPSHRLAATTMLAAGAAAAAILAPPAAHANVDYYVALAYSLESDIGGIANNVTDPEQARIGALKSCQDRGGNHCVWYGTFRNECAALAVKGVQEWVAIPAADLQTAEQKALAANPGSKIGVSGCAHVPKRRPPIPTGPLPTLTQNPIPTIVPPAPAQQ